MGKYALFIWSAYGVSAMVLVGLSLYIWSDLKRQARLLQRLKERGAPKRPRAQGMDRENLSPDPQPESKVSA